MIQGKWFAPGEDIQDALSIRKAVFDHGTDALDSESWNVVVYEDGFPAASGRLWWRDGVFWLGDVGVLAEKRGKRLGDVTLRLLLFKAQSHAAREIRLLCPEDVSGFFMRLGLRPDAKQDALLEMSIQGCDLDLDTCKGCHKKECPNRK